LWVERKRERERNKTNKHTTHPHTAIDVETTILALAGRGKESTAYSVIHSSTKGFVE